LAVNCTGRAAPVWLDRNGSSKQNTIVPSSGLPGMHAYPATVTPMTIMTGPGAVLSQ